MRSRVVLLFVASLCAFAAAQTTGGWPEYTVTAGTFFRLAPAVDSPLVAAALAADPGAAVRVLYSGMAAAPAWLTGPEHGIFHGTVPDVTTTTPVGLARLLYFIICECASIHLTPLNL
jgi:hypothetical protein